MMLSGLCSLKLFERNLTTVSQSYLYVPKVKKTNSVIHPNSRKALQLARQVFHTEKLMKRKEEANAKQKAKLTKLKWFKENTDSTKEIYSALEVKDLIDKYFNRFAEIEAKQLETKPLKRHLSDRAFADYKSTFLIQKEKQDFETCGLEIPDLMQKKTYDVFKSWNGDIQLLTAIDTVKMSKKQLENHIVKSNPPSG